MRASLLLAAGALLGAAATPAHAVSLVAGPPVEGDARVAAAGDVNGDGRPDVAIAAPRGAVPELTIIFGRPGFDTLAAPADPAGSLRITFTGVADLLGVVPGPVGDVDGDGFDDLAIAFTQPPGTPNQGVGRQEILRGSPRAGSADWSDLTSLRLAPFPVGGGPGLAQRLGDLDDDGFDDVLNRYSYSGATPCGIGPCATVRRGPALDVADTVRIGTSPAAFANPAGDVDGDGRADLRASLLGDTAESVLFARAGGGGAVTFVGAEFRDGGASVTITPVGDVTGDGRDDLALSSTARAPVVFPGRAGLAGQDLELAALPGPTRALPPGVTPVGPASDVDGDGIGDLLARTGDDGSPQVVLLGADTTTPWAPGDAIHVPVAGTGTVAVIPVADVDADGRDELAVTARTCDPTGLSCEQTRILAGVADAASLTSLRLSPAAFCVGPYRPSLRQGTLITTDLTAAATVRFTVTPLFGGPRRTFDVPRPAGRSSFTWDGRVDGRRLPFGAYKLTAAAAGDDARITRTFLIIG